MGIMSIDRRPSVFYHKLSVMVTFLLYLTQEAYNKAKLTSKIFCYCLACCWVVAIVVLTVRLKDC